MILATDPTIFAHHKICQVMARSPKQIKAQKSVYLPWQICKIIRLRHSLPINHFAIRCSFICVYGIYSLWSLPSFLLFNSRAAFRPFSRMTFNFNRVSVSLKKRLPYFRNKFSFISNPKPGRQNGCNMPLGSGIIGRFLLISIGTYVAIFSRPLMPGAIRTLKPSDTQNWMIFFLDLPFRIRPGQTQSPPCSDFLSG